MEFTDAVLKQLKRLSPDSFVSISINRDKILSTGRTLKSASNRKKIVRKYNDPSIIFMPMQNPWHHGMRRPKQVIYDFHGKEIPLMDDAVRRLEKAVTGALR